VRIHNQDIGPQNFNDIAQASGILYLANHFNIGFRSQIRGNGCTYN